LPIESHKQLAVAGEVSVQPYDAPRMRCAVLPPVPVPYREPLFELLARRGRIGPRVLYLAPAQPGWDQPAGWFPEAHPYESGALRSRQRARPGRAPITLPRGLGRALSRHDPDCVVSWEYGPATLRALAWCRRRGRALVAFSELTPATDAALTRPQLALHRALAPRIDAFVVASSAGRRRLLAMGVPPERIEVSIQSADLSRARTAGGRERRADGPVRVLCVGRLAPDKNQALLMRAFARAGIGDAAELELCGTGALEPDLRREAGRLGVPVRFRGFVPWERLRELYAEADVLALVSTHEPFGVAVREAASAGLAIVCSRTAGAAGDVAVEGENALLVDPGDEAEVAGALERVVRDAALRGRLAAGSLAVTERHPLEADAEAFERAVLGAVARRDR
jgi:glycosyltransferase involved in cell wall biosynthesis